jgi:hypothetical protein
MLELPGRLILSKLSYYSSDTLSKWLCVRTLSNVCSQTISCIIIVLVFRVLQDMPVLHQISHLKLLALRVHIL